MTATESQQEYVILVDDNDQEIGTCEKLNAHQKNLLHRAFSIFIFRNKRKVEVLLQQRAFSKYHSPGLWTNACCSHPRPGENIIIAGKRRLKEELGIEAELTDVGSFYYNSHFTNGLAEHELDHVLTGFVAADIAFQVNPVEVETYRWIEIEALQAEFITHPEHFTAWFRQAFEIALSTLPA